MKRLVLGCICFLLTCNYCWAENTQITIYKVRDYEEERSMTAYPVASYDGYMIYLSSDRPMENVCISIKNETGHIVSSEITTLLSQNIHEVPIEILRNGIYILELNTEKVESRSNIVLNYDMYWHVNLGWGNGSVAYFKLDNDATCTLELNDRYERYNKIELKNQKIIVNIRKK